MTFNPLDSAAILIVLAAALGWINHRYLGLPRAVGLTVMGSVASLLVVATDKLFPELGIGIPVRDFLAGIDFHAALMDGMLSFLLFAGALHMDLDSLLKRKWTVATLATVGVIISTCIVGTGLWWLAGIAGLGLPFSWCLVFGALISPTDPVAVIGILKEARVPKTLEAKIAGESLFNDGIGVVIFSVLVSAATGGGFSVGDAAELLALEAVGGVALGIGAGWLGYRAIRAIDAPDLEVIITLAIVMGGYALAHRLHVSGPVAMAVAGLFIGNQTGHLTMSAKTADHVSTFWTLIDETLNAVLFLLIGLEVIAISAEPSTLLVGAGAIAVVLIARAIAVGVPLALLSQIRENGGAIIPH